VGKAVLGLREMPEERLSTRLLMKAFTPYLNISNRVLQDLKEYDLVTIVQ